jgi:hypothetical protein
VWDSRQPTISLCSCGTGRADSVVAGTRAAVAGNPVAGGVALPSLQRAGGLVKAVLGARAESALVQNCTGRRTGVTHCWHRGHSFRCDAQISCTE